MMSQNWYPTGGDAAFLDPLLTDIQLYSNDIQCPAQGSVSQVIFNSGHNHDHLVNPNTATWGWATDSGQSNTEGAIEAIKDDGHQVASEMAKRLHDLESHLENRIAQFEEKVNDLQNRLEEEATRLCNKIDAHVQELRNWATELETLMGQVVERLE
ncbi:hypothetical protein Forpi1262_v010215 [Fusarium oxysporum f. sp. raphani]|uniref:Uncharacterized protein n=1 Tax=Fusarium oxysporum f. sp. raphani TaxID=96318 RepID=A0A8J5PUL2_FUSOX|nr:hypothetical protein Forpi1262_v010215 [Fusarium oxysporum f. sp. raphani]